MTHLYTLQYRLIKELQSSQRDMHAINAMETGILQHHETNKLVRQRAAERRGLHTVPDFDPEHVPGVLRKHNIYPKGKQRIVFSPRNSDYCQAQYFQTGIIGPIAADDVNLNTFAYTEGRGIDHAISTAIEITMRSADCAWLQEDIKDCFNTVPTWLAESAFPPRTWTYIQQVRHRHRELAQASTGLPQGHPASASVINVVLDRLLQQTRQAYEDNATIIAYSDDLTIVGPLRIVRKVRADIQAILSVHGMKLNPTKSRIARPVQGSTIKLLGYEIVWLTPHAWPLIRPNGKAYSRLEESLANALDLNHAEAIGRGWRNAYRLTNDPGHLSRMKFAIDSGIDRWRATTHRTTGPDHRGKR